MRILFYLRITVVRCSFTCFLSFSYLKEVQPKAPHRTKGWECNLGFGRLESFFANNGLGGFLGPKWKVFHHGTPRKHFQGVGIACGSRPSSEKGQKMGKKSIKLFCLKKMQFILKVGGKLTSVKIPVLTCPKTIQK